MKGSSFPNCVRATAKGKPCTNVRLEGFEACHRHLTPEEQARRPIVVFPPEVPERTVPACWSWPAPEEDGDYSAEVCLILWQADRCAVCGRSPEGLVEDHDHATGLVRGWLCRSCNTCEAGVHPPDSLFGRYRQSNPASILGVRLRYVDPYTRTAVAPEGERPHRASALSMLRTDHPDITRGNG